MGIAKKLNYSNLFIFLFFILFPFGQIIRIGVFHPIDIVAFFGGFYALIKKYNTPEVFGYFKNLLFVFSLTWIFSIFLFKQIEVVYGLMYLARLVAYSYFFIYVWNFVLEKSGNKELIYKSLFSLTIIAAVFGWVQYFLVPDIKPFFTWGWDEHLYRIVGTFLDPTFLGLILVFGILMAITEGKRRLSIFLLLTLAFTYSRASYLAFLVGVMYIAVIKKKIKEIFTLIIVLAGLVLVLPTAKNHSIQFMRSFSAIAKVENYRTTWEIFKKSPIFGVGYNNLCLAYQNYIGPQSFSSHACSGSDASLLTVLATTGIAGFFVFLYFIILVSSHIQKNKYTHVFYASALSVFVHSLFSNSLFYPWIMGYLVIFLSLVVKKQTEE